MNLSAIKPALALFMFTAVSAVIVGFMYTLTEEPIAHQMYLREQRAIGMLIPYSYPGVSMAMQHSTIRRMDSRLDADGELLGYVFFAESHGYSGVIHVLVGFDPEGTVLGVRIISHTETPGLGSLITRETFIDQFTGLHMPAPGAIDGITGATISVNAVLRAVDDAWELFSRDDS